MGWSHGGKFLQVFHSNILAGYEIDDMTCESWLHHLLGCVFGASKCRSTTRGEVLIGSWHTKGPMLRWERVTWYGGIELVLNGSSLPWLLPLRQGRITSHHIWSLQDPNQNHNEIIMNNIQVTGQLMNIFIVINTSTLPLHVSNIFLKPRVVSRFDMGVSTEIAGPSKKRPQRWPHSLVVRYIRGDHY